MCHVIFLDLPALPIPNCHFLILHRLGSCLLLLFFQGMRHIGHTKVLLSACFCLLVSRLKVLSCSPSGEMNVGVETALYDECNLRVAGFTRHFFAF
jgi:hypothetical protein